MAISMTNSSLLSAKDLKIGMRVSKSSLQNIKGVHITLIDAIFDGDDIIGTIAFIGKRLNRKADKVFRDAESICAVYNSVEDIDGEVTYDE